jgi:hypothetical protein
VIQFADPGGEFYFSTGVATTGIWFSTANSSLSNAAPAGRATTYALQCNSAAGSQFFKRIIPNFQRIIVGGAYYVPAVITNNAVLFAFIDNVTTQVDIRCDGVGHLFATRNGTTIGSASSNVLTPSGWIYIEFDITISSTVGAVGVWVNGVQWLNLTSQNTQASANTFGNQIYLGAVTASGNSWWKDVYCLDTTTGVNKTRLGDITVNCFFPNAAGANQAFATLVGASQTVAVQDGIAHTGTWPDGDTSYIADVTSGHISDFAHQALTLTGTIFGAVHYSYARKDDAGPKSLNQVCLSGGTTETSPTIALGNSYSYYADVIENDPNTSAPWAASGFNAATFGVKIT